MTPTASLFLRLKEPDPIEAWERLVDLYTPLIYLWACRMGLQTSDASDLVQEVLLTLVEKLPVFSLEPGKSFSAWLKTVTVNRWRDLLRRRQAALPGSSPIPVEEITASDDANALFEWEYRQYLVGRAVHVMQCDFQPSTWKACWAMVVEGTPAAQVARELGLTVAAVYAARSRVLRRLRQELAGMLE
jgi:RNA polymerase sigma-70 factor (ECF subfamily)